MMDFWPHTLFYKLFPGYKNTVSRTDLHRKSHEEFLLGGRLFYFVGLCLLPPKKQV